jgi:hypothetical protein
MYVCMGMCVEDQGTGAQGDSTNLEETWLEFLFVDVQEQVCVEDVFDSGQSSLKLRSVLPFEAHVQY